MSWYKYSSKLLATGFELKSEGQEPLSVCPTAEWTVNGGGFTHEFDHGDVKAEYENFRFLDVTRDSEDGMPVVSYEVDEAIHEVLSSDKFRGVSPVIEVLEVNDNSKTFTKYRINGISFQFEGAPACPDSFCPTEYKGGDSVDKNEETNEDDKDEEKTTETKTEEPPKVVKQVVVKKTPATEAVEQTIESTKPAGETTAEYVARLTRQNEQYEKRLKAVEADLETREAAIRKELLASIPEEHRAFAEKLEDEALANVAKILNKEREVTKETKDAATIVETGAVETTDQKKKPEETTDESKEKDPEEIERDFFDMSKVFTVSEEKSGVWSR